MLGSANIQLRGLFSKQIFFNESLHTESLMLTLLWLNFGQDDCISNTSPKEINVREISLSNFEELW